MTLRNRVSEIALVGRHGTGTARTSSRRIFAAVVAVAGFGLMPVVTSAQAPDIPGPATAPAPEDGAPAGDAEPLVARIVALKGIVQVRDVEDQPWRAATVGMELDEGAEFRTGPRSAVQFVIPPDQTITLDRLGTIKVLQAVKDAGKVTTSLGMKYGRTRYDIQAADLEHDSTIRSPGSTLAIRGTDVTFEDMSPFPPNAISREGRAVFQTNKRQVVAFGGTRRALVAADRGGPAETALVRTGTDPQSTFSGRSPAEQQALLQLPLYGGNDPGRRGIRDLQRQDRGNLFGPDGPIGPPPGPGPLPGPTPGPTPPTPTPPTPTPAPTPVMPGDVLAGVLQFELDWGGIPFTNVDLSVARGDGEVVSPTGPVAVASGGAHLGDAEGDGAGVGKEVVRWGSSYPADFYFVRVDLRNDAQVNATVKVTRDPGAPQQSVIHQGMPVTLRSNGDLGFGFHVAVPPELPGPPPPVPPAPGPMGPLQPPQPGPDETRPPMGAS